VGQCERVKEWGERVRVKQATTEKKKRQGLGGHDLLGPFLQKKKKRKKEAPSKVCKYL